MKINPYHANPRCKVCDGRIHVVGHKDFSVSCNSAPLPQTQIPIIYYRCEVCGFLFTPAFDDWQVEDFKEHIYNDEYAQVDPEYELARPMREAHRVINRLAVLPNMLSVLDYGGGNGQFAKTLRDHGCNAVCYDPLVPEFAELPYGTSDLVTCFECIEHVPEPHYAANMMANLVKQNGVIHVMTGLTDQSWPDISALNWWYVAPRNGHVSIHSRQSITHLFATYGMQVDLIADNQVLAYRQKPDWYEAYRNG